MLFFHEKWMMTQWNFSFAFCLSILEIEKEREKQTQKWKLNETNKRTLLQVQIIFSRSHLSLYLNWNWAMDIFFLYIEQLLLKQLFSLEVFYSTQYRSSAWPFSFDSEIGFCIYWNLTFLMTKRKGKFEKRSPAAQCLAVPKNPLPHGFVTMDVQ